MHNAESLGVLLVVIIVLGVGIFAALIFGIVFVIRKQRERMRVGSIQETRVENANTLSNEDIERYFPALEASKLGIANFKEEAGFDSMDCIPMRDCVVCLCPIEATEEVRLTYCNHLFHKDCLTGWFAKTQVSGL